MSGHSKWSTIKRKKGKADAERGRVFTKLIKEITVAARMGGGDTEANPRLRSAIAIAKASSMPADNIKRAIQKGLGELEGVSYEQITYEGYGPGGVAVMVEVLTDNKNRTVAEVRHLFSKYNGNLGENGCVGWIFERKGLIEIERGQIGEDELLEFVLDAGASDLSTDSDIYEVSTSPEKFEIVRSLLEKKGIAMASAEITMIPQNTVRLDGKSAEQMIKMYEALDENDDVQKVYANFDIDDEVLETEQLMKILGIDPGLAVTGYGVLESDQDRAKLVNVGSFAASNVPIASRLKIIFERTKDILASQMPDEVAVEEGFYGKNVKVAVGLGQARAAVILASSLAGLPVFVYAPREVKQSVVGSGGASKEQVQYMIKALLAIKELPTAFDPSDALAVAYCHYLRRGRQI